MKKSVWTNPKFKGEWTSSFESTKSDRVFTLTKGNRVKSFESWQQAVKLGWKKS